MPDSSHPTLPIVPRHVAAQFARRGAQADARFLHDEIASRMLERLSVIRIAPTAVLDAGCGLAPALPALAARFPEAQYTGLDASAQRLALAQEHMGASQPGWRRLLSRLQPGRPQPNGAPRFVQGDLASTGMAPESVQFIWSCLALHWHPEPHAVFDEWWRVLAVDGLALFSSYGPGSLRELRSALTEARLETQTLPLVDMHDLGDLMIESGFGDPVMDQDTLTLTYADPARLLADVRTLGGNPAAGRRPGLLGRAAHQRLLDALAEQRGPDGQIRLTLEINYGHAWRGAARRRQGPVGEVQLSISSLKRSRPA